MRWHQGTISEAVNAAKENRSIFVVFIYGSDEHSVKMDQCLNESSLSETLDAKCVSLKLEKDSEGAKQFSQIYPVVIIPSVFFIGVNGIPLEVLGGYEEPSQLLEKINNIMVLHDQQKGSSASGGAASTDTTAATVTGECSKVSQSKPEAVATETSGAVAKPRPESAATTPEVNAHVEEHQANSVDTPENELDNRVERAKALIAQRQEAKAKEEFEKEKQKEIERRQMGKNLQDFKQRQKEMETKKIADEIAREKAEEQAAREKIREQIARDRAERANKYQVEKEAEEIRKKEVLQAQRDRANAETANRSNYTRLQFKLPEGIPVVQQFEADAKLQEVYNFVKETVKPPFASFRLCLIFPRRDFQKGDYSQTLRDLQLVPNASLLILPESNKSVIKAPPGMNSMFWTLVSPLLAMWKFVYNLIFGAPNPRPPTQTHANTSAASTSSGGTTDSGRPELKRPRLSPQQEQNRSFTRREGNIHRIAGDDDDEDENNTWNGNSTQQM